MGIFAWIVVGLIAGSIAKAIMPGTKEEPSGWMGTMLLGIVGAIVGGFLGDMLLHRGAPSGINLASIFVSVVGACIALAVLRFVKR